MFRNIAQVIFKHQTQFMTAVPGFLPVEENLLRSQEGAKEISS